MQNINNELPIDQPPSFAELEGDSSSGQPTVKDQALVALEEQLQALRDARLEERFIWIVAVVILMDIIWFRSAPNASLPVVVMILELVALLVIARRMGVDDFVQLVDRILHAVSQKGSPS